MKRYGNLFDNVIDYDNLVAAERKAGVKKGSRKSIIFIRNDVHKHLKILHNDLIFGTYKNSKYNIYHIYEPKLRIIYTLPYFPDRIVHHAIMNILEQIWDKQFIYDSYACRKGKGQHKGVIRCMQFVRKYKYCLKCDISQFYISIDHDVLKQILRRKIKDERLLKLLDMIIDSVSSRDTNIKYLSEMPDAEDVRKSLKKLLRYKYEFPDVCAGLPIGNYLSQWFGNLYLNEFDEYVKYKLKCKAYLRYCDDFIIFGNDKSELHEIRKKISLFLHDKMHLLLSKDVVFTTKQGVDFLGYRMFHGNYVLLRKSTVKRVKRRINKLIIKVANSGVNNKRALSVVASTKGWLKWANTHNLAIAYKINELEEVLKKDAEI